VKSAARRLRATNPFIRVVEHRDGITAANALQIFHDYDVIVDGTDNFPRYLNNDAAVLAKRPRIRKRFQFDGRVSVFAPHLGGPCYRCLFPQPAARGQRARLRRGGRARGVMRSRRQHAGARSAQAYRRFRRAAHRTTADVRSTRPKFSSAKNCPRHRLSGLWHVAGHSRTARGKLRRDLRPDPASFNFHGPCRLPARNFVTEARRLLSEEACTALLVDVREPYETEICQIAGAELIPMRQIPERMHDLPRDEHLLILCHVGGGSMRVTEFLRAQGFTAVSNVAGGISAWPRRSTRRWRATDRYARNSGAPPRRLSRSRQTPPSSAGSRYRARP